LDLHVLNADNTKANENKDYSEESEDRNWNKSRIKKTFDMNEGTGRQVLNNFIPSTLVTIHVNDI
jgi:hypothetical protein